MWKYVAGYVEVPITSEEQYADAPASHVFPHIADRCGSAHLADILGVGGHCDDTCLTSTRKVDRFGCPAKLIGHTVYIIGLTRSEHSRISDALRSEPVAIETYDSAEQFLSQIPLTPSGCILVPCDLSGMGVRALIVEILGRDLPLPIVVLGRGPDLVTAVQLVRAGAPTPRGAAPIVNCDWLYSAAGTDGRRAIETRKRETQGVAVRTQNFKSCSVTR